MPVVLISLADYSSNHRKHTVECPYCASTLLHRWGVSRRDVVDNQTQPTDIFRFRCLSCGGTFRIYPTGFDRAGQSVRIRNLAAIIYALGLSAREVSRIFQDQGIPLNHMVVWREGTDLVERVNNGDLGEALQRYSFDRQYIPRISQRLGVVVAIDLGLGKRGVIGTINEDNPKIVKDFLERLISDETIRVNILGTDFFEQVRLSASSTAEKKV